MPLRGRPILAALVLISLLLPLSTTAVAGRTPASRSAASAPFTPPDAWRTLCTTQRPAGRGLRAGANCRWLRLDGVFRRYVVVVPAAVAARPNAGWPMVLMFHGYGVTGERMLEFTDWVSVAAKADVVTVFPTGWRYQFLTGYTVTAWDAYGLAGKLDPAVRLDGYPADAPYPARDIEFLRRIVRDVSGTIGIDPRRIHTSGSSNGGQFMTRVAVEASDLVASISCSGFCDPPPESASSDIRRAVPILYGMGVDDEHILGRLAREMDPAPTTIPLDWSEGGTLVARVVGGWMAAWRLEADPTRVTQRATRTVARWSTPRPKGMPGAFYRVVLLLGVHHEYPARQNNPEGHSLPATSWSFFRAHPMP